VDDLLMDLSLFEGRSQFSTWVHSYFRFRCLTELRYRNRNLGDPLVEEIAWMNSKTDDLLTLARVQQNLSTKQQAVVQSRLEGYTAAEIASQLNISERTVYWIWESVLQDLGNTQEEIKS
jgi:DNA-directed RNA polymerase specialized sigma24 family protein